MQRAHNNQVASEEIMSDADPEGGHYENEELPSNFT